MRDYRTGTIHDPKLNRKPSASPVARPVSPRSPGAAVVLSFVSIGLGHLYAGRWARGLAIFFGYPVAWCAYVILGLRWCNLGAPEGTRGYWLLGLVAFGWVTSWLFVGWVAWDAERCAEETQR